MFDLHSKKEDLVNQAVKAFENYTHNRYDESAVQARKSGESIAKILLAKGTKQKLALNERSGYKELIAAVKAHTPYPKKTVNLLETLQLVGNKASHASITATDAEYAIQALRLLCQQVFTEVLNEKIPPRLYRYLQTGNDKQQLLDEITRLKKQAGENKPGTPNKTDSHLRGNDDRPVVTDPELLRRIAELEAKVKEQETKEPVFASNVVEEKITATEVEAERSKRKWWIVILAVATAVLTFVLWPSGKQKSKTEEPTATAPAPVLRIAVFNFDVIQNNNLVKLEIEKELSQYIDAVAGENKWKTEISRLNEVAKDDATVIKQICLQKNMQLAIYGTVEENREGDSCTVILKYLYAFPQQAKTFTGSFKPLRTDFGTRSGLQSLKKETAVLMNLGLGLQTYYEGDVEGAYELTKELYSSSPYLLTNIYQFNYACLTGLGRFDEAKHEAYHYISDFPDSSNAYEMYVQSLQHFLPGSAPRIDSALTVLEKKYPQSAVMWYLKAKYAFEVKNDKAMALKFAERSRQLDYRYFEGRIYFARLLMENGYTLNGLTEAKDVMLLAPERYESYWVLAEEYYRTKNYPKAIAYYKTAATKNGLQKNFLADLYEKIGTSYYHLYPENKKLADSVMVYLDKAIETGAQKPWLIYASKAGFYFQEKDVPKAIAEMEKAVKLKPDFVYGHESLAGYYVAKKNYGAMVKSAERTLELEPANIYANAALGNYYAHMAPGRNNYLKASAYANRLVKVDPNNPVHWVLKGQHLYYNLNQTDSAAICLKKALKLDARDTEASYLLGEMAYRKKEYYDAIGWFKKTMDTDRHYIRAYIGAAQAYTGLRFTRENFAHALDYTQEALEIDPQNALAHFTMAQVQLYANNTAMAKQYYDKAVQLDARMSNPDFEAALDEMYKKLNQP